MTKRLQIMLSEKATNKYLDYCGSQMEAEVNESVEPTFPILRIEMSLFENSVFIDNGNSWLELGESDIDLVGSTQNS